MQKIGIWRQRRRAGQNWRNLWVTISKLIVVLCPWHCQLHKQTKKPYQIRHACDQKRAQVVQNDLNSWKLLRSTVGALARWLYIVRTGKQLYIAVNVTVAHAHCHDHRHCLLLMVQGWLLISDFSFQFVSTVTRTTYRLSCISIASIEFRIYSYAPCQYASLSL